jgi:hypothetical protein
MIDEDCSEFLLFKDRPFDTIVMRVNLAPKSIGSEQEEKENAYSFAASQLLQSEMGGRKRLDTIIERGDESAFQSLDRKPSVLIT